MTYTRTFEQDGSPCFRDKNWSERGEEGVALRYGEFPHAVTSVDEIEGPQRIDSDGTPTYGDLLGQIFFKPKTAYSGQGRGIGSWFHAAPCVVTGDLQCLPVKDSTYAPDDRYEPIPFQLPPNTQDLPVGTLGLLLAATKEDGDQEPVFFGGSALSRLIAANRGTPYTDGTDVYDLNAAGEPDPLFNAKLQSAWMVMTPGYGPTSAGQPFVNANFFMNFAQAVGFNVNGNNNGGLSFINPQTGQPINVGFLPNGANGLVFQQPQGNAPQGGVVNVGVNNGPIPVNFQPQGPQNNVVNIGIQNNQPQLDFQNPNNGQNQVQVGNGPQQQINFQNPGGNN